MARSALKGKQTHEDPHFEVIACIAGRGFKVRREDMKKLLIATRGNRWLSASAISHHDIACKPLPYVFARSGVPPHGDGPAQ